MNERCPIQQVPNEQILFKKIASNPITDNPLYTIEDAEEKKWIHSVYTTLKNENFYIKYAKYLEAITPYINKIAGIAPENIKNEFEIRILLALYNDDQDMIEKSIQSFARIANGTKCEWEGFDCTCSIRDTVQILH